NSQFRSDSHPHLSCLCGGKLINSLIDHCFVDSFRVERLIECDVGFAHSSIKLLAVKLVFLKDHADPLPLLRCQAKLFDLIGACWWGQVLTETRTGPREQENCCRQEH